MNPCRNGKIAHLPHALREDLNQRLHNGVPGHVLLAWLNADPEVQRILAQYYPGRRITQQNLSEWRQGGYQDWVKLQHTKELTLELAQDPEAMDLGISPKRIAESMATITAADFMHTAQNRFRDCSTTEERWKHVCKVNTEVCRLRHANHRAALAALQKEQWDRKVATETKAITTAAEAKARHEMLTHLDQILRPGRAELPLRPNIPTVTRQTQDAPSDIPHRQADPHPASGILHPASVPHQNPVETAHFPSGTHPNHAHNISSPSTSKTGRAELPLRPNIKAATRHAQSTTTDISTANPPIQQGKNHVETAHFPSRTNPNQTHNYFTPTPYAPIPPTPKFLRRLLPPISPALACGTGLSHGGPTTLCVLGASVAAPRTGTLEHLFNGLSTLPV